MIKTSLNFSDLHHGNVHNWLWNYGKPHSQPVEKQKQLSHILQTGFPQFHERSQLYDISTMPAHTESISLSISFIKAFFYRSIPALSAKSAFRPISIDCFSSGRLSNAPLYPFSNKGVPFAIRYSLDLCQYFGHKKLKVYADFFYSSSSFCLGVI